MRELIRPTLFIIARVGLFLAAVAIIGAQSTWRSWRSTVGNCDVSIGLCDRGWTVKYSYRRNPTGFKNAGYGFGSPSWGQNSHDFEGLRRSFNVDRSIELEVEYPPYVTDFGDLDPLKPPFFHLPGVFVRPYYWGATLISVHHGVILTMFALFYGVLKWVYRKRGTELAGDE